MRLLLMRRRMERKGCCCCGVWCCSRSMLRGCGVISVRSQGCGCCGLGCYCCGSWRVSCLHRGLQAPGSSSKWVLARGWWCDRTMNERGTCAWRWGQSGRHTHGATTTGAHQRHCRRRGRRHCRRHGRWHDGVAVQRRRVLGAIRVSQIAVGGGGDLTRTWHVTKRVQVTKHAPSRGCGFFARVRGPGVRVR